MKTQKQNEPQLSELTEENAKKYLIMKINLTQLKDETQTRLKETILNDYWLELKKSQALATALEEQRAEILSEGEDDLVPDSMKEDW